MVLGVDAGGSGSAGEGVCASESGSEGVCASESESEGEGGSGTGGRLPFPKASPVSLIITARAALTGSG